MRGAWEKRSQDFPHMLLKSKIKIFLILISTIIVKILDFCFNIVYNLARIFKEVSNTPESGRREGIE